MQMFRQKRFPSVSTGVHTLLHASYTLRVLGSSSIGLWCLLPWCNALISGTKHVRLGQAACLTLWVTNATHLPACVWQPPGLTHNSWLWFGVSFLAGLQVACASRSIKPHSSWKFGIFLDTPNPLIKKIINSDEGTLIFLFWATCQKKRPGRGYLHSCKQNEEIS
jgi:hypothetical protein